MRRFANGTDQAFADLERRAQGTCVVFRNVTLPPGASPSHVDVGFEVRSANGAALLLVERGISYRGPSRAVAAWLRAGEMCFPEFEQLKQWLRRELGSCYQPGDGHENVPAVPCGEQRPPSPHELTDIDAIRDAAADTSGSVHLHEDDLFRELSMRVRGQDEALRKLARRVCRHIARKSPRRPATIFAIGPTAVGKTKATESLPAALRTLDPGGAGYSYLRLDMSEYQERHRMSQLLGAPQGYVGYGEGAQLTDALAANPRTIVHLDEIEKAHPDIFKTLMNAMDAGRLSTPSRTAHGRQIDCRPAIFIFTSNLDATGILADLEGRNGFGSPAVVDQVCRSRLRAAGLAPELVGRIGCFLVFRPLTADARVEITTLAIVRVAEEYGLRVARIAPAVVTHILEEARGDGFGARPDEYLVDEVLGACFGQAAQAADGDVEVTGGPPFACVALKSETEPIDGTHRLLEHHQGTGD